MYGVELTNNIIVAAGSVVCSSFDEEMIIIAGNPARKIGTWDSFKKKYRDKAMSSLVVRKKLLTSPELFIRRKVSHE